MIKEEGEGVLREFEVWDRLCAKDARVEERGFWEGSGKREIELEEKGSNEGARSLNELQRFCSFRFV